MNIILETREKTRNAFIKAFKQAQMHSKLPACEVPDFVVETPKDPSHGDFAVNMAMLLAKPCRQSPRVIASIIADHLQLEEAGFEKVEVAGPGFLNVFLKKDWLTKILPAIQKEDGAYGQTDTGESEKVLIEFVSANPTGLLHMGNARGGALGDAMAAVMACAGYDVKKEFYINDAGNQVKNLGLSLEVRYLEALGKETPAMPEDGYQGEDIKTTAQHLVETYGDGLLEKPREAYLETMTTFALKEKIAGIENSLNHFGVTFDRWFSEQSLHDEKAVQEVIDIYQQKDWVYEKDGALWLRATDFGEKKDQVLIKSDGLPTYFATDIAYHKNKFDRGFTHLIDIWGADHHGHVARMKGALDALGYPGDKLTVILIQLVHLFRDGEKVRMSKRKGNIVTLDELMDEVGRDAARFFFVMRNPDSTLNFDLDLAKAESADNPVYYVQYAHARIVSLLQAAGGAPQAEDVDLSLLTDESEVELLRKLADYPDDVARAAQELAPYQLAYYARELAGLFHTFYTRCKVISDDAPLQDARLVLADTARITLRNVLTLLKVDAPNRM